MPTTEEDTMSTIRRIIARIRVERAALAAMYAAQDERLADL